MKKSLDSRSDPIAINLKAQLLAKADNSPRPANEVSGTELLIISRYPELKNLIPGNDLIVSGSGPSLEVHDPELLVIELSMRMRKNKHLKLMIKYLTERQDQDSPASNLTTELLKALNLMDQEEIEIKKSAIAPSKKHGRNSIFNLLWPKPKTTELAKAKASSGEETGQLTTNTISNARLWGMLNPNEVLTIPQTFATDKTKMLFAQALILAKKYHGLTNAQLQLALRNNPKDLEMIMEIMINGIPLNLDPRTIFSTANAGVVSNYASVRDHVKKIFSGKFFGPNGSIIKI